MWPSPRRQSYHRRIYHARRARGCEQGNPGCPVCLLLPRWGDPRPACWPRGGARSDSKCRRCRPLPRPDEGHTRVFVTSSCASGRRLPNHAAVPALLSGKGYLLGSPGPLSEARLSSCRASHGDAPVAEGTNSALPGPRTGPGDPALHPTLSHPTSGAQLRSPGGSPCNAARFREGDTGSAAPSPGYYSAERPALDSRHSGSRGCPRQMSMLSKHCLAPRIWRERSRQLGMSPTSAPADAGAAVGEGRGRTGKHKIAS